MQVNLFFVLVTERWVRGFVNICAISTSGSIHALLWAGSCCIVISFRIFKNVQTIAPGVIRHWIIYKLNRAAAGHLGLTRFQSWTQQRMKPVLTTTFIFRKFIVQQCKYKNFLLQVLCICGGIGIHYQTHTHTELYESTTLYYSPCLWFLWSAACLLLVCLTSHCTVLTGTRNCRVSISEAVVSDVKYPG